MVMIWVLFILMLFVDDENDGDDDHYYHLYDSSGPMEGRVSQTSLVEGAISVALLPG